MTTSIIMVVHNQLSMTRRCVDSVRKHTEPGSYEWIVVDNASADGTREWLSEQPDIQVLEQSENLGFPRACNIGAKAAAGDKLLFLNNDTVATPRWLTQLEKALDSDEANGAVGPLTNFASYGQMIATSYLHMEEMERFAESFNASSPDKWEERLKLIGFCLLVKREAWNRVGPFDERFGIGNFEDDDWCMRAREAGYRLLLCKDTFIHHEGHATFQTEPEKFRALLLLNEQKFQMKWGFHPQISANIRDDLLAQLGSVLPGAAVLDIGCGCGGTLLALRQRCPDARLFGVESAPRAAAIAGRVAEQVWHDVQEVSPPSHTDGYDAILLSDVREAAAQTEVLQLAHGLLRTGGVLLSCVPNRLYVDFVKAILQPFNRMTADMALSREEAFNRYLQAGYADIRMAAVLGGTSDAKAVEALSSLIDPARHEEILTLYYIVRCFKRHESVNGGGGSRLEDEPAAAGGIAYTTSVRENEPHSVTASLPRPQDDVVFTGERLVLNAAVAGTFPDVFAEHVYRYLLARPLCVGKSVLDAACGTGYGSRMLMDGGAGQVMGIDIDAASIELARRDYGGVGVGFTCGNVLQLPIGDAAFDVVVSFETIEHVPDGGAWLREAARVLKPEGRLIVSTPNREVTNPDRLPGERVRNPYHCFEYTLDEFVQSLSEHYEIEAMYGQTFRTSGGHLAPDMREISAVFDGSVPALPGMPLELSRIFAPVPLNRFMTVQPAYAIAVCRKRPE